MNTTSTKPLSGNDKVIHYLNSSMNTLDQLSSTKLYSSRSSNSLDCDSSSSSSSSVFDSPSQSDTSLSDPIAYSSSNQSFDEDLDFNIGFDQIEEKRPCFHRLHTTTRTIVDQPIVDEYFRQLSNATIFNSDIEIDYHPKQISTELSYDSTYTLCSDYMEDEPSITGLSIRSNSFSAVPHDAPPTFIDIKASKKVVHFADMLGLDLESIRYMTPPDQIANSFIQESFRLPLFKNPFEIPNLHKRTSCPSPPPSKQSNLISKNFISPINITPLIYKQQILLECLYTKNACAYGTIRVNNCTYDKHVFVRLSFDEWQTTRDLPATHSMNYSHDNTDTFIFEVNLTDENRMCKRILFALCFQVNGEEFWDNNQGWNYVLDVFERR